MSRASLWITAVAVALLLARPPAAMAAANDCPNGGKIRFGVEPYDTAARLVPIYQAVGKLIGEKLGCEVEVFVATSYNAEIEAMRNGKLEIGEFGPLGYVLAHQVAKAEAVAAFGTKDGKPDTYWASIVTYPGSGIKTVAEIKGHSFAFPTRPRPRASVFRLRAAQGRHRPRQGHQGNLRRQPHLVLRGALQREGRRRRIEQRQLESAKQRGHYKDGDLVFRGNRIRSDRPVPVRGDLPAGFKERVTRYCRTSIFRYSTRPTARSWSERGSLGWCHRATAPMTASATWSRRSISTWRN